MNDKMPKTGKIRAFLNGFMSAFDISGQPFISIPDLDAGFQADCDAIKGDWEQIGGDLRRAMDMVSRER
jgi:hypothetical protein